MQARKGKWQPFDALEGYKDALRKVEYEIGKIHGLIWRYMHSYSSYL